ncbi:MAG: oligosaccharide flippase family protein [Gloeobacteraceae cyanobacterium ES-bin-144]|nr:oligosaccharide flippase family protein [Verrucomicrobiales bacterium]
MFSIKGTFDAFCPPFLSKLKARIEASPVAYRLARGAFWSLAGTLISRGLGLLAGILVARLLGKEGFGQLGMIQSTAGMFGIFAGFGMGLTANKHVAEFRKNDPARAGRIIAISSLVAWGTGGLMSVILFVLAPWLARTTLASPEMSGLLQTGALLLVLGGVNGAQTGALAGFEAFKTIARVNLTTGLLAVPITLIGAWRWGVVGSVWALVINLAINCALNFLALRREASAAGVPLGYDECFREWPILWKFSLPAVMGGAVTSPVIWGASALLVNQADGYSQMGVYNAVMRIKIVPEMLLGIVLAPLLPVLSERFAARDVQGYQKVAYSAFMLCLLVTAPVALLQIGVPELTTLLYGAEYSGNHRVVQWLMFELAVLGFFTPFGQMVASMNKMWFGFSHNLAWASLFGVFAWVLVPRFGAAGLAASPILAHLVCLGPSIAYVYRKERAFLVGMPLGKIALLLCGCAGLTYAGSRCLPNYGAFLVALAVIAAFILIQEKFVWRRNS